MNINISTNPCTPNSLKFTAQGYMKITSTSKRTKRMATRKYLIWKGARALPTDSTPHSKDSSLTFVLLFGPNKWVAIIVVPTKPTAATN